jgi:hypothetical protein
MVDEFTRGGDGFGHCRFSRVMAVNHAILSRKILVNHAMVHIVLSTLRHHQFLTFSSVTVFYWSGRDNDTQGPSFGLYRRGLGIALT